MKFRIDWPSVGSVGCLFAIGTVGLLVGATTKPAEVRAKDPNRPRVIFIDDNTPTNMRPDAITMSKIERLNLDGHLYYWRSPIHGGNSLLMHAAGCTNHVCPVSVQAEAPIVQRISEPPKPSVPWVINPTNTVVIGQHQEVKMVPGSGIVLRNPEWLTDPNLDGAIAIQVENCRHEPCIDNNIPIPICKKCGKPIKAVYK